jgi:hypothetical protein
VHACSSGYLCLVQKESVQWHGKAVRPSRARQPSAQQRFARFAGRELVAAESIENGAGCSCGGEAVVERNGDADAVGLSRVDAIFILEEKLMG